MQGRSNIILLTADSLRADFLGCSGSLGACRTPEIDWLARHGVLFQSAYAQGSYTPVSLPSLFTGKLPCRLKPIDRQIHWRWNVEGLRVEGNTTFVEILKDAGYHTAAFHSNPYVSRFFGFDKGFDVFYDDMVAAGSAAPWWLKTIAANLRRIFRTSPFLPARNLNEKVLAWLGNASEPFFLWVHYMDTHGPYTDRKVLKLLSRADRLWHKAGTRPKKVTPGERACLLRAYRRKIRSLDAELGKLWRRFEQKRLFERSLVLFSADHGDEFFEHGGYQHLHRLYDELLHVPLIARLPGGKPSTQRGLTGLIQIAPTILAFAGLAPPGAYDGASFLPALLGERYPGSPYILAEAEPHDEHIAIRTAEWKLIWKREGAEKELYHLAADPNEQRNVASERPEMVRELERQLLAHRVDRMSSAAVTAPGAPAGVTEEEQKILAERLRDLGYL
jgi:arylsulfatase A-like enzyme